MYLELNAKIVVTSQEELNQVCEAFKGLNVDGQGPNVSIPSEKQERKRRTKEQIAADEAAAKAAESGPSAPVTEHEPHTAALLIQEPAQVAEPVKTDMSTITGKTYTDEELRAKAMPKIKELGQPKMQEVLKAFGIKSITEAGPSQREIFMQKIDSYTALTDPAKHFVAGPVEPADTAADFQF